MTKSVGILGSGVVGQTLAKGFSELGYEVRIGSRTGKTIEGWQGKVGTFAEVAGVAELIVLCVKGSVAKEVIEAVKDEIDGKTVIDTTNPISSEPAVDGVLNFFTTANESLMEQLQQAAPAAHFVKAFNSVGSGQMVNPHYAEGKPTMFICGNNADSKEAVEAILAGFGWEVEDLGTARAASAIEPLCILWCIPGLLHNQWTHAFKLLNK